MNSDNTQLYNLNIELKTHYIHSKETCKGDSFPFADRP